MLAPIMTAENFAAQAFGLHHYNRFSSVFDPAALKPNKFAHENVQQNRKLEGFTDERGLRQLQSCCTRAVIGNGAVSTLDSRRVSHLSKTSPNLRR
jgi:hypothetical protein